MARESVCGHFKEMIENVNIEIKALQESKQTILSSLHEVTDKKLKMAEETLLTSDIPSKCNLNSSTW